MEVYDADVLPLASEVLGMSQEMARQLWVLKGEKSRLRKPVGEKALDMAILKEVAQGI